MNIVNGNKKQLEGNITVICSQITKLYNIYINIVTCLFIFLYIKLGIDVHIFKIQRQQIIDFYLFYELILSTTNYDTI